LKVLLLSHIPTESILKNFGGEVDSDDVLRHLSFTFAIEGISRACSHQLVRHRVASFSQQSQRYVTVRRLAERVVIPDTIREKAAAKFRSFMEGASEAYQSLVDEGIPKEDARFVLPNATETNLLMTMEGRPLMHFFGLRCCNRAQWEIRALADEMLWQVRGVEPKVFGRAGPYCYQLGYCPEGRFSCGRMEEAREKYANL